MPHHQDTSATEAQAHVKTILVVEDDEATGEVITLALAEEAAYHVLVVSTASEALLAATTMPIDLFVIDYYLAGANGIELYDQMHCRQELHDVPVLLLSASLEQHVQELQERHLVGLSKPFELEELLQMIEQMLLSQAKKEHAEFSEKKRE
jgi:DNA-binding NtrC family response regulator